MACELSSADELLLTEMIFTGVFTELTPQSAAALLSCMVFQEKVAIGKLEDTLSGYLRNMQVSYSFTRPIDVCYVHF